MDAALQLVVGLPVHRAVDDVHRDADREDGEEGRREENAIGERGEDVHRIVKSASTSPPASAIVTDRRGGSPWTVSFQTASV